MKSLSVKMRVALAALVVVGGGVIIALEFTDWHQLDAVTLNGTPVDNWPSDWPLLAGEPVLRQPVEAMATRLLADSGTVKVDIEYAWPRTLKITTNRFVPVCFVVDAATGRMHGLNRQGRMVPLSDEYRDWERPILTGVKTRGLFEHCEDVRVELVIPELIRLADDNIDFYRLIDEIDFGSEDGVRVLMSGLPYRLRVKAESFYTQVVDFVQFVEKYQPDITLARELDLRYNDMIVEITTGKD